MSFIPIDLDGYTTQVHHMHISKNSFDHIIKPYIDVSDLDASFISWFAKENPSGGCFCMFQHCLKFDNNNGTRIFVLSKFIIHGTLNFNLNSLSQNILKIRSCTSYQKMALYKIAKSTSRWDIYDLRK
jgi:hypothetical protein